MPDARLVRPSNETLIRSQSAVSVGELWQTQDGKAAYYLGGLNGATAGSSGEQLLFRTDGKVTVPLTSSIAILEGGRVYWDHSANLAHFRKVNDRDFYIGRAVGDTSGGTVVVDLNSDPPYDIDLMRDANLTVPIGTQALGGFGEPKIRGGARSLELTATNEAQKIDLLSVDGFALGANAIVDIIFRVPDDGAGTVVDFNIGVANATHATDADAITEHLFIHTDANNTNLNVQSKDTSTTVAATDSTKDYTEGAAVTNRVECWLDLRTPADCQVYIDGVNVLPSSVFNLNAVASTLFLLAHLEKTSSTDVYRVVIDAMRARYAEQEIGI